MDISKNTVWKILPCSLVEVPLSGQFANTNSATQVRLFLPCNRKVQSRRERSRAFCVSSLIPLQGGILWWKMTHEMYVMHKDKAQSKNDTQGMTWQQSFRSNMASRSLLQCNSSQQLVIFSPHQMTSTYIRTLILTPQPPNPKTVFLFSFYSFRDYLPYHTMLWTIYFSWYFSSRWNNSCYINYIVSLNSQIGS
jgi:hypothetical protein